jgi:hypothetical protein
MPVSSSSVITYESRLIDSGNARAIFKVTTTTTTRTSPDTPEGITVSESLQFESVDYSELIRLAAGDGIHTIGPYEYLGLINVYKTLVEQGDILKTATIQKSATKVAAEKINEYLSVIKNLPKQF